MLSQSRTSSELNSLSSCCWPHELRRCCHMPQNRDRGRPSARTDHASRALARAPYSTRRVARPRGCSRFRSDDENHRGERARSSRECDPFRACARSVGRRQEELVGARSRLRARNWHLERFERHEGTPGLTRRDAFIAMVASKENVRSSVVRFRLLAFRVAGFVYLLYAFLFFSLSDKRNFVCKQ